MKRPAAHVAHVKGHYIHKNGKRIWIKPHITHIRKHHKSPRYRRIEV